MQKHLRLNALNEIFAKAIRHAANDLNVPVEYTRFAGGNAELRIDDDQLKECRAALRKADSIRKNAKLFYNGASGAAIDLTATIKAHEGAISALKTEAESRIPKMVKLLDDEYNFLQFVKGETMESVDPLFDSSLSSQAVYNQETIRINTRGKRRVKKEIKQLEQALEFWKRGELPHYQIMFPHRIVTEHTPMNKACFYFNEGKTVQDFNKNVARLKKAFAKAAKEYKRLYAEITGTADAE